MRIISPAWALRRHYVTCLYAFEGFDYFNLADEDNAYLVEVQRRIKQGQGWLDWVPEDCRHANAPPPGTVKRTRRIKDEDDGSDVEASPTPTPAPQQPAAAATQSIGGGSMRVGSVFGQRGAGHEDHHHKVQSSGWSLDAPRSDPTLASMIGRSERPVMGKPIAPHRHPLGWPRRHKTIFFLGQRLSKGDAIGVHVYDTSNVRHEVPAVVVDFAYDYSPIVRWIVPWRAGVVTYGPWFGSPGVLKPGDVDIGGRSKEAVPLHRISRMLGFRKRLDATRNPHDVYVEDDEQDTDWESDELEDATIAEDGRRTRSLFAKDAPDELDTTPLDEQFDRPPPPPQRSPSPLHHSSPMKFEVSARSWRQWVARREYAGRALGKRIVPTEQERWDTRAFLWTQGARRELLEKVEVQDEVKTEHFGTDDLIASAALYNISIGLAIGEGR